MLVSAALPYLSIRYSQMASRVHDIRTVEAQTETAASLDPTATLPFAVRANAHKAAAEREAGDTPVRVEEYRLAAAAWIEAVEREPQGWLYYYKAAEMFVLARDAALTANPAFAEELEGWARTYLDEVHRLNPLSPQAATLEKAL